MKTAIKKLTLTFVTCLTSVLASNALAQKVTIGLSQPNVEHPYRVAGVERAKAWAAQRPEVTITVVDGRRDSAVQMASVEDLIQRRVSIIIMSPNNSLALAPVADAAKRANIPLVIFDRKLTVDPSMYAAYVGADDAEMGKAAAQFLAAKVGGKGKIIQLEGTPGASATVDRKKGFEAEIAKYPGIQVVSYVGHYRLSDAVAVMEDASTAHRGFVGVYGHNDSMAMGAAKVVKERNLQNVAIVGIDGGKEACDGLASGALAASIYYPTMFPDALDIAMKVIRKESVPKSTILETPVLTKSNMAQYCK
ncbi:RbsB ABC-type sugar transport system, periplasmic component [Burkholderiaceae bacterium]